MICRIRKKRCLLNCTGFQVVHRLPKDEAGRKLWLKQVGRKSAPKDAKLCDRHFSEKMKRGHGITPWGIPDINLPDPVEFSESDNENEVTDPLNGCENIIESDTNDNNDVDNDVEKTTPDDETLDFDDLLAKVHCIADIKEQQNNNNDVMSVDESLPPENGSELDFDATESVNLSETDRNEQEIEQIEEIESDNSYETLSADSIENHEERMDVIEEDDLTNKDDNSTAAKKVVSATVSPIQINNKFKRKLIASVKKRRILYDPSHPSFDVVEKKIRAWEKIGKIQRLNGTACRELWVNIRYEYQNHVRNLRRWLSGEASSRNRPRMPFENNLLFLWPFIQDKSTCDDIDEEVCIPRNIISHIIPGIPDNLNISRRNISLIVNNYARSVDHPYANKKTDESTQFACNLIDIVRYYSELYDPRHPNYGNPKRRSIIWTAISTELKERAFKCLFTWIQLQIRYEFEKTHNKYSYVVQKLDFLEKFILENEKSPFKRVTTLDDEWYEPINTSEQQHLLLSTLVSTKRTRPLFFNIESPLMIAKEFQDPCWLFIANSLQIKKEQCEITWIIMQAMYCELSEYRENDCQLADEWEFESKITKLRESVAKSQRRYGKDIPVQFVKPVSKPEQKKENEKNNDSVTNCDSNSNVPTEISIDVEPSTPSPISLLSPEPPPLPPMEKPKDSIEFDIPAENPNEEPQRVRFQLDTPLEELTEKTIVDVDNVLKDGYIVVQKRYQQSPLIFVFTLKQRRELIGAVMARPILFNKSCRFSRMSRIYWGELSMDVGFPADICSLFWEFIMEKELFVDYDRSWKKSTESKWVPAPYPIFDRFTKLVSSKHWDEYASILPDFMQEIGNFPLIYVDLKINTSWNRRQCNTRDISEAWSILARKFSVLENHKSFWEKFKQIFISYMSEMELSMYNPWPKLWAPTLAKLTFLLDLKYNPKEPIYFVIKEKIEDEIKEIHGYNVPKRNPKDNAKDIFKLLKEKDYLDDFSWVNKSRFISKIKSFPMLYDVSHPEFGNKDAKLDAWQEMALSFHCTVGECHLIFQHLMKSFLLYRARDPNQICRVTAKYWESMTYIYSCAMPNSIDPTSIRARSFRVGSNGSTIKLAEEFQAEICLVDAKPRLVLKNFASAVNSLPIEIQDSIAQEVNLYLNEYTRNQNNDDIVVDIINN